MALIAEKVDFTTIDDQEAAHTAALLTEKNRLAREVAENGTLIDPYDLLRLMTADEDEHEREVETLQEIVGDYPARAVKKYVALRPIGEYSERKIIVATGISGYRLESDFGEFPQSIAGKIKTSLDKTTFFGQICLLSYRFSRRDREAAALPPIDSVSEDDLWHPVIASIKRAVTSDASSAGVVPETEIHFSPKSALAGINWGDSRGAMGHDGMDLALDIIDTFDALDHGEVGSDTDRRLFLRDPF